MCALYNNNERNYLISSYGTYYNIIMEIGKTNNQLLSNEILATYKELQFNKDNIFNIINQIIPISYDDIRDIGNNQFILAFTDLIIVNSWLDIHNYLIKYT